ncbi:uroporphyrinogen-III C-methyltransferase [Aeromicrobium duanguangcaii]|uniref:uroporphyrinogen-III C-methyltransferase n=1 Tax=Aeromicrobium duanguangcaii TaxID=2968086 RepID=UPI002017F44E|nr:uroporphyrinogen-III C-methyltransferase [Aeromicrobium duanguangcaii]
MSIFPLGLRLEGRRVVVVGGGHVATRRAFALAESGADVHVVSPAVSDSLASSIGRGTITWHARAYRSGDLDGAWLVQTATGVPSVDDAVADDAESRQIFCLKGGDPERATAWMPAVARVDDVTIAVSGGGDAGRASALRDALATALQTGDLPLRHRTHPRGLVALVGGGPGDPGLLTARGRRLLAEADVVVFDRLAPQSVLAELAADVEVIDVGKQPDHHPIPQEQINALLVDRAREGKVVVRLKGGDPYVFGRGGEELLACREAGIEVEVVPGVTSAIAVAASAGIPVTHRGVARGFSVITGHESLGELPRRGDHTLVMLMGVKRLRSTAEELIAAGHDPATPAAVIERGFSPDQRTTIATLGTIADQASDAVSPAITVIGDVVSLAAATTGSAVAHQTS